MGDSARVPAPARVCAPACEDELMRRARALAGHTVAEVAAFAGRALPADPGRAKGFIGELVELSLGASAGSAPTPDFPELGVELKTIPIDAAGRPRESTFVCSIRMTDLASLEWEHSRVRRKLARVLFVPVEWRRELAFGARRFGRPRLWSPTPSELAALRADWEELIGRLARGDVERISAHLGQRLQVRPKAAHAGVRTVAADTDGAPVAALPRGFYLRASFTRELFRG